MVSHVGLIWLWLVSTSMPGPNRLSRREPEILHLNLKPTGNPKTPIRIAIIRTVRSSKPGASDSLSPGPSTLHSGRRHRRVSAISVSFATGTTTGLTVHDSYCGRLLESCAMLL